jgi:hypothetical protein
MLYVFPSEFMLDENRCMNIIKDIFSDPQAHD